MPHQVFFVLVKHTITVNHPPELDHDLKLFLAGKIVIDRFGKLIEVERLMTLLMRKLDQLLKSDFIKAVSKACEEDSDSLLAGVVDRAIVQILAAE